MNRPLPPPSVARPSWPPFRLHSASSLIAFAAGLLLTPSPACASAEAAEPASQSPPFQPTLNPVPPPDPDDAIIVTGKRWGQADIASERELDEDDIGAYGADNIGELVRDIAPLIDGSGDVPVLLVNGKRISDPSEITGYPPEALAKLAILPPEAASRYGYASGQRVVNLELKKHFVSWAADTGVTVPTAGGRYSAQLSASRSVIDRNMRWNASASLSRDTALLKSERDIPVSDHDVALGQSVVGGNAPIDPHRFETLAASGRTARFNAGLTHPIGKFSGAFNIGASRTESNQLVGMPIASIFVPSSPNALMVSQRIRDAALESNQASTAFNMGASLSGPVAGWQTSLSVRYSRNSGSNLYERGYDASAVQHIVDGGTPGFDPFGPWPDLPLLADRTKTRSSNFGANLNISKPILTLPAGPMTTSLTVNASSYQSRTGTFSASNGSGRLNRSRGRQADGQISFNIPVASRAQNILAPLGDISLDVSGAVRRASGAGTYYRLHGGARWSPFTFIDLRASVDHEHNEPAFDQLRGARMEIITRMFDFARQEYVQPLRIFGGNPDLRGGSRRTFALNAMIRPFKDDLATFNIGYQRNVARDGITAFPALTPEIEAAFSERVIRDASGRLVAIDSRPVNIAHDVNAQLSSGLALRWTEKAKTGDDAPPSSAIFKPWMVSATINHRWLLKSETLIRDGLPVIDQLNGSGQSRHSVNFQIVASKRGMGATLDGNWNASSYVRGGTAGSGMMFRYPASTLFNLSLFAEPEHLLAVREGRWWASDLRVSLDIQNLLNGYRRMDYVGPGTPPKALSRDEIDPIGRTVRLTVRKRF